MKNIDSCSSKYIASLVDMRPSTGAKSISTWPTVVWFCSRGGRFTRDGFAVFGILEGFGVLEGLAVEDAVSGAVGLIVSDLVVICRVGCSVGVLVSTLDPAPRGCKPLKRCPDLFGVGLAETEEAECGAFESSAEE